MKSLTAAAANHCASHNNDPVLLFEIEWSDTEIGRYAERTVSVGSDEYAGVIEEIGPIVSSFGHPAAEFSPIKIRVVPHDEIRDKLLTESPEGKEARIKLFFIGTEASDTIELFSGLAEKLEALSADRIELSLIGMFHKHDHLLPSDIVSLSDFPKAHVDDVGKSIPIVFGEIPALPTLRVKTGKVTNLLGSILSDDATLEVDDTTGFPASGTLLVEEEQVTYTGINGNVFTGCTRGANGTDAAEHLNRAEVIEYMTDHIFLVAGQACKDVENVKVAGIPVEQGACLVNKNNTILVSGKTLTTISFTNMPKAPRQSGASRFLEMQFDETAAGNEADDPSYCYDTTLEGFGTLVAKITGAGNNDTLRIKQTTDVTGYATKYGEILKTFLMVEHFESEVFVDDYLSAEIDGQSLNLARPSLEDTAGGGGDVDIDHGHTHSITGEHTHTMTIKKQPVYTNVVTQTGGSIGGWSELDDIAGENLNKSGFTVQANTDKSLKCVISATTSKGSVEQIQFCCRRGESGMSGSFWVRFYFNGNLEKTYQVSGTSSPQTWKSGWDTISGLDWDDLDGADTYILITPASGNSENIRLFGAWYELEYLEQPDNYEGTGTKDTGDVDEYSGDNANVINEEPISSTSIVEAADITDLVAGDWTWFNDREVQVNYNVVNSDDGVTGYILHVWFEVEYAPLEEVVSDDITCDVQGIETVGDGTGDLIENPADVIKHILVEFLGFDMATQIDQDSFSTTKQSLSSAGAEFAFSIRNPRRASDVLQALALQARSRLFFDCGKFCLAYQSDSLSQQSRDIVPSSLFLGSPTIQRIGMKDISNKVVGYFCRDYRRHGGVADKYVEFSTSEDAQSQTTYGSQESRIELSAIRASGYAADLVDFMLSRRAVPRNKFFWRAFLRDVDLERGDVVRIGDPKMGLIKAKGEIVKSVFLAGGAASKKTDSIAFTAELEAYELYWFGQGGTYIRLVDNTFYFVVRRSLVARMTGDGVLYIKGFAVGDQSLPASSTHPVGYDAERGAMTFALSDNTRVMELDENGNVLLPLSEETDQELSLSGSPDEIDSDDSKLWINIGSACAAEVSAAGLLKLPKHLVEDCNWELLYE